MHLVAILRALYMPFCAGRCVVAESASSRYVTCSHKNGQAVTSATACPLHNTLEHWYDSALVFFIDVSAHFLSFQHFDQFLNRISLLVVFTSYQDVGIRRIGALNGQCVFLWVQAGLQIGRAHV